MLTSLALFGALSALGASSAEAASLRLNKAGVTRNAKLRTDPVTRFWINRAECLGDDVFHFPLTLSDYGGSDLEVWASEGSGDCTTRESRTTSSATCWRVFKVTPSTNVPVIDIRVQDIAAKDKPPAFEFSVGTAEDCTGTSTAAQSITLYFMLIASLDNQAGETYTTSLDLIGPNAPSNFSAGVGSKLMKASWNANTDTDVAAYRFFCDPPAGTTFDADTSFGAGPRVEAGVEAGNPSTGSICPDASSGSDEDAGEDGGIHDASSDQVCTDSGSGGSGGTTSGVCGPTVLARDFVPDPDFIAKYQCGPNPAKTATSSTIQGLTNFLPTYVAIASIDAAGNVGPLSDPICGTPQPVNGFEEAYSSAGGNAGDGFCSIAYPGAGKSFALRDAGLAALTLLFFRRRRRTTLPVAPSKI